MTAQLQGWQNFYMLLGGASATLAGLMFIAITLASTRTSPREREILVRAFNAFMSPTYIHFVYTLVTSMIVFIPTLSETAFGIVLLLAGLGSLGYVVRHIPFVGERYRIGTLDRSDLVWYTIMPSICYILYLDSGIGLLRAAAGAPSLGHALDALAASSVLLIVIGVRNAWDLVVFQVMRAVVEPGEGQP